MKKTVSIIGGISLLLAATSGAMPAAASAAATSVGMHTAAVSAPKPAALAWWHPTSTGPNSGLEFQWEIDHPLNVKSVADMGSGTLNAASHVASAPTVFDLDGVENPASTVAALHNLGDKAICYIEIGSAGNYYSAADEGIPVTYYAQLRAAGDLGRKMQGYPEYYVNLRKVSTVAIMKSMILRQCADKGFDAVEPDIDDSYTDKTNYTITETQNEVYDNALGTYAHSLGLAWGQKNGDNDAAFSRALEPTADFLLDEECNFYKTCGIVTPPYVQANKLVLNAEYTDDWGSNTASDLGKFCKADISGGIDGTLFSSSLAGKHNPCQ